VAIHSHRPSATAKTTREKLLADLASVDDRRDANIDRIRLRIAEFERMYGMPSDDMTAKVNAGELAETDDILLWRMDLDLLRHVASA
jgi:hypothetical protein